MARLTIPALQTYCRVEGAVVTMKRGTDIYRVTADEVRCLYMSDQTAPLDPRIVFKCDKNVAFLDESELVSFGEGLVREQKVLAGGALSPNTYKSWTDLCKSVEDKSNLPVTKSELSLRELLEAYGFLAPDLTKKAAELATDGETFGLTLVRTKSIKLEDLLRGAIGPGRYFKPKNHVANDLGRQLIAKQKLTPSELKSILPKQVREKAQLDKLLIAENLLKPEDLEKLEPVAIELPDYDHAVEFLVRNGKITRSELLHYTLRASKRGETAIGELVEEQKVKEEDAAFAQRLHDCKVKLRLKGSCRLGELLVDRGLITEAQLIERLQYQVEHAAPLGALLVAAKMITPEQLIDALIGQDDKLGDLARKEAKKVPKKVEAPPPPPKPQFELPKQEVVVVVKKTNWREGLMALGVISALIVMGLWQANQMNKLPSDKPDPAATEPINPVFAFFAGEGGSQDDAYFTAEDLEGEKKLEVEKAAELDPQYAEQVNRLGVSLKTQSSEVDALLEGESELLPTPPPLTPPPVEQAKAAAPAPVMPGQQPKQAAPPPAAAPVAAIVPAIGPTTAVQARPAAAPAAAAKPAAPAAAAPAAAPAAAARPAAPAQAAPAAPRPAAPAAAPAQVAARPAAVAPARPAGAAPAAAAKPAAPAPAAPAAAKPAAGPPQIIGGAPGTAQAAATRKPLAADRALNMQALAALAAGAHQQARDALSKAVALAADNPVLVFNLGVADLKLGQYAQASRSFNRARQLYETAANELQGKVKPYLDMDQLPAGDRAFKLMRALIRANSLLADTVTYQGKAREGLGESMDARRFFREAAGLYRKNAEYHKSLGDLYLKRNDLRNAVSEYAISAKADPRYAEPWKALSLVAVSQKKEELANRYMAIYRRLSGG